MRVYVPASMWISAS